MPTLYKRISASSRSLELENAKWWVARRQYCGGECTVSGLVALQNWERSSSLPDDGAKCVARA